MKKISLAAALLLILATGWKEESKDKKGNTVTKVWRVMDREVLALLENRNLIRTSWNSDSMEITEKGKQKAQQLLISTEQLGELVEKILLED